jgi:hypothetical protein
MLLEDGTSWIFLEDGTSILLLESSGPENYTLSGPDSGVAGIQSKSFVVTPSDLYTGHVTIALLGGGISMSIVLTFTNSAAAQTFTIIPTSIGTVTLTPSNDGGLPDFPPLNYAVMSERCYAMTSAKKAITTQAIDQETLDVIWYRNNRCV